jgi:hypothetical protein
MENSAAVPFSIFRSGIRPLLSSEWPAQKPLGRCGCNSLILMTIGVRREGTRKQKSRRSGRSSYDHPNSLRLRRTPPMFHYCDDATGVHVTLDRHTPPNPSTFYVLAVMSGFLPELVNTAKWRKKKPNESPINSKAGTSMSPTMAPRKFSKIQTPSHHSTPE